MKSKFEFEIRTFRESNSKKLKCYQINSPASTNPSVGRQTFEILTCKTSRVFSIKSRHPTLGS